MQCPHCLQDNSPEATVCEQCAAPLARACAMCGGQLSPGGRFCPQCAHPVADATAPSRFSSPESYTPQHLAAKILTSRSALEGERKQVTVLFADVAGFSSLAERLDPEVVHLIMDGCFTLLSRHVHHYEGTINQFTGDGIMALFGAPIAHEDHAIRALQAALSIRTDLAGYAESVERRWGVPFQMRFGSNTGSVVVARIGDNLRMDYTAQGDTTNLAARLQQMAPAGAIWVGESTYRVASGAFEWRSLGPVTVKGRETLVGAYELVGRRALRSRFEVQAQRGLTRFIGRDREFAQLRACWTTARRGSGQVVSVIGEAGMGKSRLLHEFKDCLTREGTPYLEGSSYTYGDSISYLPFLEVVKDLFGLEGIASEAEAKRRIDRRLSELGLHAAAVSPYLHNLLAFTVDDADFVKLPPHLVRERTVTALTTLIEAMAARQPTVLIIEDVHWIDQATEEVLGALVDALPGRPLLLVLVYRPEYLHASANKGYHAQISLTRLPGETTAEMVRAILHKPYASQVPLERLSPGQSTELVHELLGSIPIPPELERLVADKTDGNPFFIEELTLSLRESGDLRRGAGGYVLERPVAALALPATVQGVLLARIDRLDDDLKQTLQFASVIGRVFSAPVLAEVAEHPADLDHRLRQLEALEFIYPTTAAPPREYSFKHVLTQQAVYDALLRPKREALHERVGAALEALYPEQLEEWSEVLAYHYVRSTNADKAVAYLDRANQKAGRLNAMVEAKAHFHEAMRLLDALPDTAANRYRRVTLLVNQTLVFFRLFELVQHYADLTRFEPIAAGLGQPSLLGAYYGSMSWYEFGLGEFRQSIETATKGAELCEAAGNPEGAAMAYMVLGWSYVYTGDLDHILALEPRVERARDLGSSLSWYTLSLSTMATACWILGRREQAIAFAEKELRIAEEFKDRSMICQALWVLAWPCIYHGDYARAIEALERSVRVAPTVADRSWAEGTLAAAYCRSGQAGRAVEIMSKLLPGYRAARFVPNEAFTPYFGEAYWRQGDDEAGRAVLEELLQIIEPRGVRFFSSVSHRVLGEMAMRTDPAKARGHFERAIAVLADIGAEPELALAHAGYGRLQKQLGALAEARASFTRALALFEHLGTLNEPDTIRRELAALPAS